MCHFKLNSYITLWVWVLCLIASGLVKLYVTCPVPCLCVLESGSLYTTVKCDLNGFDQENDSSLYPFLLPINTTVVELQSVEAQFFLERVSFMDSYWDQVLDLTINGGERSYDCHLSNNSLNGLDKLKILRMHNLIGSLESGVFLNTPQITTLDLSMNPPLSLEELTRALLNTLPKLKYLDISYINIANEKPLLLGPYVSEIIDSKHIEILNVSGTKQITFDKSYMYTSIQIVNISRCSLDWIPRHFSPEWFPNIREIDISKSSFPIHYSFPHKTICNLQIKCKKFLRSIRSLYANDILISLSPLRIVYCFLYFLCGSLPIEFIDISNINIGWLNVSTNVILLNLKTLIVSRNSLEYISPKLLNSLPNMRTLHMEGNNLGTMQYFPDFEEMFSNNKALETLDISWNNLSFLPRKVFVSLQNLRELSLHGNRIVHFDVKLEHLHNLRTLDLSNNGPVVISYTVTRTLEAINTLHSSNNSYFHSFNSRNISAAHIYRNLVVNLKGNIFDCSCKQISFFVWLAESKINFEDRMSYKCGEEFYYREINKDNVRRLDDYCNLQTKLPFIIVPSIIGGLLIICIVLIMKYARRRGKVNRTRRQYVNDYKEKFENEMIHLQEVRYPAFLSFCSDDNDVAKGYFYPMITKALQAYFGEKEVLALGETIFKPGKLINVEIEECFSRTDVILFLVTLDFIESNWCRFELNQADLLGKPTIYLVENTVLKGKLPLCLGKLKTHTRATWTREGNDIKISPDWNLIAKQVLDFALVAMKKNHQ